MNIKINLICPSPASNILSSPGAVLLSKKKESVSLFPSSPLPQLHNSFYTTIIYLDRFEIKITPQAPLFANWAQYQCPCLLSVQKLFMEVSPIDLFTCLQSVPFPFSLGWTLRLISQGDIGHVLMQLPVSGSPKFSLKFTYIQPIFVCILKF